jgi:hypothetical protein
MKPNVPYPFPLVACLAFALGAAASACTHVAPYERGHLAHATMGEDDYESRAAAHVRAVHEGATGGGPLSGGGCGCN